MQPTRWTTALFGAAAGALLAQPASAACHSTMNNVIRALERAKGWIPQVVGSTAPEAQKNAADRAGDTIMQLQSQLRASCAGGGASKAKKSSKKAAKKSRVGGSGHAGTIRPPE